MLRSSSPCPGGLIRWVEKLLARTLGYCMLSESSLRVRRDAATLERKLAMWLSPVSAVHTVFSGPSGWAWAVLEGGGRGPSLV